jgi:hypothetical protein
MLRLLCERERPGVLCVETIGKIRRWHRIDKLSISQIARRLGASPR